ncbi:MAG: hypothetical protein IJS96_06990 [Schwartzia sp.]|nr:hypothetical protein [Schwartzia sp. (in: firmicutes)]
MAAHTVIENATSYDELMGGPEIPVLTKNLKLAQGTAYKRGMLITLAADGKTGSQTSVGGAASFILKDDIDTSAAGLNTAAVGTVYASGRFNREKLVLVDGDTADAHEEELRQKNIFLTSIH